MEQGAVGSGQDGCTPSPQPSPPRERALNTALLLTAVLWPDLAPGPSGSQQCPAGPGLPFISCPVSPPRREEKSPAGAGTVPWPPPPASGDSNKAGTVPVSDPPLHGTAAAARPEPCWGKAVPGAGLAQRVTGSATGKSRAWLPKAPPTGTGGLDALPGVPWGDIKQCHPCTRSRGSRQHSLCHPAAKKDGCLPHTPGVLELPAPWGATPKAMPSWSAVPWLLLGCAWPHSKPPASGPVAPALPCAGGAVVA